MNKIVSFSLFILCFAPCIVLSQPLFRLDHPLVSQILTDKNQHIFSLPCSDKSADIKIVNLFSDEFDSYRWNMGNGLMATTYLPPQITYKSGEYDISLTVKSSTPFAILDTITILQINNTWLDCGLETFPDIYLEIYDLNKKLVIRTNPIFNKNVPVKFVISGILLKKIFSIKVKEADTDIFCTDDNLGEIIVPSNYAGGTIDNLPEGLKVSLGTKMKTETTFKSSILVSVKEPVVGVSICDDNSYILSTETAYQDYSWSDGSSSNTLITTVQGLYNVTVTDNIGCEGYYQFNLSAPPKSNPTVQCVGQLLVCDNHTSGIRWLDSNKINIVGAFQNTYLPTAEGIYYAESWTPPCSSISQGIMWPSCDIINSQSNIEEKEEAKIHPNPNNGDFYVHTKTAINPAWLNVVDVYGTKIEAVIDKISEDKFHVILPNHIPKGVYLIRVQTEVMSKIVVTF